MSALTSLTLAQARDLLRKREFSAVELTKAHVAAASQARALNAFVLETPERAHEMAARADAALAKGEGGPLAGVPLGVKDMFATKGVRTTACSHILDTFVPTYESTVSANLWRDGGVMLAKLNNDEFAMGSSNETSCFGPVVSPWRRQGSDAKLVPGGSSGGSAAAVAAHLCLGAVGTDTGGSIRGPAAYCGIAGLKPTYGLVSRAGVAPAAFSLDHIGPMAWTAEDCAIMLQALAGHDPRDPASADRPIPDYRAALGGGIKGLKVGVIHHFHETDHKVGDDTQRGISAAIETFRGLGAEIREVQLSPLGDWHACGSLISIVERAAAYEEWARTRLPDFGERMRTRLMLGAFVSGVDYLQAVRRRRELRAELRAAMAGLDVVLTAVFPNEPPKMDAVPKWDVFQQPSFMMPFNVAGYPAMSVCSGFGAKGLPLAIQLVGKPFREAIVLRIADAFEKATAFRDRRPLAA